MMPERRSSNSLFHGICPKVLESGSRSLDMSAPQVFPDQVCYVNCNFCSTVLVVNVPCGNPFTIASVRCGHCASMLSVNLGNVPLRHPAQDLQIVNSVGSQSSYMQIGSSSRCGMIASRKPAENTQSQMLSIPSPEKRQRVPSAYNKFIREEIRRLKASNPALSHREAFSAAAKNWAHFPRIHFGLSVEGDEQTK